MSMRVVKESLERQGTPRSLSSEATSVSSDGQMELEIQQFNIVSKKSDSVHAKRMGTRFNDIPFFGILI